MDKNGVWPRPAIWKTLATISSAWMLLGSSCQGSGSATFTPGSGTSLGTISNGGVTYQILADGSGNVSKIISSAGNTYTIGADGSLSGVTTPDGTTFGFVNNGDGTMTITFSGSPDFGSGHFTVQTNSREKIPDAAASLKPSNQDGPTGDPLCDKLVPMCENIEFFLEIIFPVIRQDIVDHLAAQHPGLPFADTIAGNLLDGWVNDMLNNCAGIKLLALVQCP